jgi:energy-coupling factor transporter ATP-binding protein EcfA2
MVALLVIHVSGLGFCYPAQDRHALRDATIEIEPGRITWLTGHLGAGTSTFLLAVAGLAPRLTGGARQGEVRVNGVDPAAHSPLANGIAYLSASPALQLSGIARTVRDEVAIGPMNLGLPHERIASAVADSLRRFGVEHLADRSPGALSGGETQRIVLAALHAASPTIWLLDEPFSALDQASRAVVAQVLRSLADAGGTIVIASDDADMTLGLADRVIVLAEGTIVLDGTPAELLAGDPIHAARAGSTEAAELARDAGMPAPRPLTGEGLIAILDLPTESDARPAAAATAAAGGDVVLHIHDASFRYSAGPEVLAGAALVVRAGESLGIFGVNGAGKSTLLRLAMALEHPSRGGISVLGRATDGLHPEDLAPRVGFLSQHPERQLFATSVRTECRFSASLAGWNDSRIDEAVLRVTGALGLDDVIDEHPGDLPLPRRRLVALAAVLVTDPDLLLLDEPTAGLDPGSRRRAVAVLRDRSARGRTTIAVTHDHVFAHEALDRAVRVETGRVHELPSIREALDGSRLPVPAALMLARALGLRVGHDRSGDVATAIAARLRR